MAMPFRSSQIKFTPCVLAATISVLCVANAKASPVTYTESATVSGTITASGLVGSFTGALLTLTGTSDTANIQQVSGTIFNDVTASFTLSGGTGVSGSGKFTDLIAVLESPASAIASFGDNNQLSLILGTTNAAFSTYALSTSIGPITGSSTISSGFSFPTSAGALIINSAGDATFTAVVTPLPAALPLFATGIGALGLLGWRRKRKAHATA